MSLEVGSPFYSPRWGPIYKVLAQCTGVEEVGFMWSVEVLLLVSRKVSFRQLESSMMGLCLAHRGLEVGGSILIAHPGVWAGSTLSTVLVSGSPAIRMGGASPEYGFV